MLRFQKRKIEYSIPLLLANTMNDVEKDYYRLEDDLVDRELRFIEELYNGNGNLWECEDLFPLMFVIGNRDNLNDVNEPLKNTCNYYVYEPWDYTNIKFGVDTKKRVRGVAVLEEVINDSLTYRSSSQTGSFNGIASGLVRYMKQGSAYYHYKLYADITKEGEENKALLQVVTITSKNDIKKSVYRTNKFVPITEVECCFTCGDIVKAMGFMINAKHARIHDIKAFIEDLSINFSKCFMNDIAESAFTELIKNDATWEALLLHFQERLSYYLQYAAEQNGIKLNARVDII